MKLRTIGSTTLIAAALILAGCSSDDDGGGIADPTTPTDTTDTPDVPDDIPGTTDTPDVPGAPDDVPGTTDTPDTPDTPDTDEGQPDSLEIRDSFTAFGRPEAIDAIESVSGFFEASLPDERPYFEQRETSIPFSRDPLAEGLTESVLIDIDAAGTGTY